MSMPQARRDRALTVAAVLFTVLAVSNLLKPLQLGAQTGFVFLGRRLTGTPNAIMGPLFGLYLLVYAAGIWNMRRWALPMGVGYAAYVVLNLALFNVRMPQPPGVGYKIFGVVYSLIAIGVSAGTVYLLAQRRDALS
jgi:hypothetical protein